MPCKCKIPFFSPRPQNARGRRWRPCLIGEYNGRLLDALSLRPQGGNWGTQLQIAGRRVNGGLRWHFVADGGGMFLGMQVEPKGTDTPGYQRKPRLMALKERCPVICK